MKSPWSAPESGQDIESRVLRHTGRSIGRERTFKDLRPAAERKKAAEPVYGEGTTTWIEVTFATPEELNTQLDRKILDEMKHVDSEIVDEYERD